MRLFRTSQVVCLMATLAISPVFGTTTHRHSSASHLRTASKKGKKSHVIHGQRVIDSGRASEIQNALIKQKYMTGSPSGQWDSQTQAAMQQYQSDHGWQTKLMPDSRALISLGLGPSPPRHGSHPPGRAGKHGTGTVDRAGRSQHPGLGSLPKPVSS